MDSGLTQSYESENGNFLQRQQDLLKPTLEKGGFIIQVLVVALSKHKDRGFRVGNVQDFRLPFHWQGISFLVRIKVDLNYEATEGGFGYKGECKGTVETLYLRPEVRNDLSIEVPEPFMTTSFTVEGFVRGEALKDYGPIYVNEFIQEIRKRKTWTVYP
jgi:hypothetical protein